VSNVTVSLTATDAGSGVATISYRVDGGAWTTFAGPFLLRDGTHLVVFHATDVAGLVEADQSASVQIDTTPPASVATLQGTLSDNGWFRSNVTVDLNATDLTSGVAGISYAVDNGSWLVYSGPFLLTNGQHQVQFYATDNAGLVESPNSIAIKINTIAPVTTLSLAGTLGSNGWYVSDLTVTLSAADGTGGVDTISYRLDGGAWATYAGPFVLTDGAHTLEYYATDIAGNVEPGHSRLLSVDTTVPQSTAGIAGTLGENGWYVSGVTVTLAASDATSGIATISYRVDNGSWQSYTAPFQLGDGHHFVQYVATDHAGLTSSIGAFTAAIDTTAPSTTASLSGTPGSNGWYISNVTISFAAYDAASGPAGILYRVDGGPWVAYSGPFVLGEGSHVVSYYATDRAGLTEAMQSRIVRVDSTPPVTTDSISGTSGAGGWYTSDVLVTLNATDAGSGVSSVQYRLDGAAWLAYGGPIAVSSGGRHTLEFASVDAAGNREAVHSLAIDVDLSDPSFTSLTAPQGPTTSPIRVSWTATDNDSGIADYAVSVDGDAFTSVGTATGVTLNLSGGSHVVRVRATDLAGRSTVATISIEIQSPVRQSGSLVVILVPMIVTGVILFLGYRTWRLRGERIRKAR
jgi:hypothetical protein